MELNAQAFGEYYYFRAGQRAVLFEATRPAPAAGDTSLSAILDRFAIHICYCSVYGSDCGEVLLATVQPEVRSCRR